MTFPLYLDEHIDRLVAVLLRQDGFDVLTTQEAGFANRQISDEEQLKFATSQGRAILTHNTKDFEPIARLWADKGEHHSRIIISGLRPPWRIREGVALLQTHYPLGIHDICLRLPNA